MATKRDGGGAEGGAARWWRVPLLAALLAGGLWWLPRLRPFAADGERDFLVDPAHLAIEAGPAWLEGDVGESLRTALAGLDPVPLRDDAGVERLLAAVRASSGWIRALTRVEKAYPNRLELEVALREPVALLESDRGLVLVDAEGVVVALARDAQSWLARHELPLVHGTHPLRAPAPGHPIQDKELATGLDVACELLPHQPTLRARGLDIDVIDLTARKRDGDHATTEVELFTAAGLPIEWGRSSRHPKLGVLEPSPDAKVRGLLRIAALHPELAGLERIRLQFAKPTWIARPPPRSGALGVGLATPLAAGA